MKDKGQGKREREGERERQEISQKELVSIDTVYTRTF